MKKKDTGIAILPNGVPIREELRDQLLKRDWNSHVKTVEPNILTEADGRLEPTTKDLEVTEFSGWRVNEFTADVELWLLGKVAAKERCYDVAKNPGLLADMHERVFATAGSIVALGGEDENPVQRTDETLH